MQALTDDLARRLGYEDLAGVVVSDVKSGSVADKKSITPGMLIMEVNREPVKNPKEFHKAIEKGAKKGTYLLRMHNGQNSFLVGLRAAKEKE